MNYRDKFEIKEKIGEGQLTRHLRDRVQSPERGRQQPGGDQEDPFGALRGGDPADDAARDLLPAGAQSPERGPAAGHRGLSSTARARRST